MTPLRWECVNCLVDWPEPYCDHCGAALTDSSLVAEPEVLPIAAVTLSGALTEGEPL